MKKSCAIVALALCPAMTFGQQGTWEPWFHWGNDPQGTDATIAINLIHVWNGDTPKAVSLSWENPDSRLWTPPPEHLWGDPGIFEETTTSSAYLFCGGQSAMANGLIFHAGGHHVNHTTIFNPWVPVQPPFGNQWNNPVNPPSMTYSRWYPTVTTLPDGRILVCAGRQTPSGPHTTIPELYVPDTNSWTLLNSADRQQPLYPYMFVLPDGNLIDAGPGSVSQILETDTWTWGQIVENPTWPTPLPPRPSHGGSAVMYEPGKIMRCGGGDPARDTTWVFDADSMDDGWKVAAPMNEARRNFNLVILPDGKVLALGGNTDGNHSGSVFDAEIYDPASGTWTPQPPSDQFHPRRYHSTAMLLPDGRVVSAGGEGSRTGQIFRPAYFDQGVPRPEITDAPEFMEWGEEYRIDYLKDVENGGGVATKAALVRLAATTHGFDMDQRYVPLEITEWDPTDGPQQYIMVAAPPDGNHAPPGMYMLFILNEYAVNQFGPSRVAAYVMVGD